MRKQAHCKHMVDIDTTDEREGHKIHYVALPNAVHQVSAIEQDGEIHCPECHEKKKEK